MANLSESSPIFILGFMRSGTTLLSFILDSHPNIAIGRETHIMKAIEQLYGDAGDDENPTNKFVVRRWYERYGLSREQFTDYIRDFLDRFFGDYARRQGKKRWGEKTPQHTEYCDLINEIFPNAQFIHIVRDPRAVAYSLQKWKISAQDCAERWRRENNRLIDFGKKLPKNRYLLVRYEDLVMNAEASIRQVLNFLGEPWDARVLHHERIESAKFIKDVGATKIDLAKERIYVGRPVVEGGASNDPARSIDTDSLDKWQRNLRKVHIDTVQKNASELMELFHYPLAKRLYPLLGKVKVKYANSVPQ